MPRKYERKDGVRPRKITWSEDDLSAAMVEIEKKQLGLNEISRRYGIPSRTLRRRYSTKNSKRLSLGKHPILGFENENRLVEVIRTLEAAGFPVDRKTIRTLAYQFAEKMRIKHNFKAATGMAGNGWLQGFLERHPELSLLAKADGGAEHAQKVDANRREVNKFYELLTEVLTDNELMDKPERIYAMDQTCIQLSNNEEEDNMELTVVACCCAAGNFIPPALIVKDVNVRPECFEGLPTGCKIFKNRNSARITPQLFHKWLTEHFVPIIKPEKKALLFLNGHDSEHLNLIEVLETAKQNDVILLCLPSHITSALKPLDRAILSPFVTFFNGERDRYQRANPHQDITRSQFGKLIGNAWSLGATAADAAAGFHSCGIYPVNCNAILDSELVITAGEMKVDSVNEDITIASTSGDLKLECFI